MVLLFENEDHRISHSNYYLPKVEIKDYNVMTDGKNFLDQTINSEHKTYENVRKLQLVKETITRLVACWIILMLGKITR